MMESATKYSLGSVVTDVKILTTLTQLNMLGILPFWVPTKVLFGSVFTNADFEGYVKLNWLKMGLLPPSRHSKNVIESKCKVIRDIFSRLQDDKISIIASTLFC